MVDAAIGFLGSISGLILLGSLYALLVVGERLVYWLRGRRYDDADARCSVAINLTNSGLNLVGGLIIQFGLYIYIWQNFRLLDTMPLAIALVVGFLWHDFAYYVEHRLGHRVGLLWAMHSVHHSSNSFNHSVAARGFFLDGLTNAPWHIPAALLGVPPVAYAAVVTVKSAFGIWNHASYVGHLGRLESLLATPLNHKIHHANQSEYIDRNYGQVLLLWDRLLGTRAEHGVEPVPGLVNPVHDNNPLTAQFTGIAWLSARVRSAERWQDKLAYLWRPPEWSHDGTCRSDCPKYGGQTILAG